MDTYKEPFEYQFPIEAMALMMLCGSNAKRRRQGRRNTLLILDTPDNNVTVVNRVLKVGRNEPCPCGSGRKFKKCCI